MSLSDIIGSEEEVKESLRWQLTKLNDSNEYVPLNDEEFELFLS
jgi:hypothetical protein